MPVYAHLEHHDVPCPNCGAALKCGFEPEPCFITFQWGYCASRSAYGPAYQVGDNIYWRPCRDWLVRGETSFDGGYSFNVGDPALSEVIVLDVGTDTAHFPQWCSVCGVAIGGAALLIENNVIKSVWAFLRGQLTPDIPAVYYTQLNGETVDLPAAEAEPWQAVNVYVKHDENFWMPMREWEFRGPSYFD